MDLTQIVVAALPMLGTTVGSVLAIMVANKLTNYRIEQLEKKVNQHNNLIERVYKVEARALSNSHRIDEIKEEVKEALV